MCENSEKITTSINCFTPEAELGGKNLKLKNDVANNNENDDEDDEETNNIKDVGLGSFFDTFKDNLIQHSKVDKKLQNIDRLLNNDPGDYHRKELLMKSLTKEHTLSMGLPTSFISKKEKTINLKKPKNLVRLQNYYGDLDNEELVEAKGPNPSLLSSLGKNEFFCKLCDARCNGLQSFEAHMKGSKHFKKMKKVQEINFVQSAHMATNLFPTYSQSTSGTSSIPAPDPLKANVNSLLQSIEKPLIGLQYLTEFCYDGDLKETKYFCELCEKRCDNHTMEAHLISYAHRWSYIKMKYPDYADDIREYGSKKQDRNEAIEEYAARIESKEDYPRRIKKSVVINANKVVSVEEALDKSSNAITEPHLFIKNDIPSISSILNQARRNAPSPIEIQDPYYKSNGLKSINSHGKYTGSDKGRGGYGKKIESLMSSKPASNQLSLINEYLLNTALATAKSTASHLPYKKSSKERHEGKGTDLYDDYERDGDSRTYGRSGGDSKYKRSKKRRYSRSPSLHRRRSDDYERRHRSRSSSTPPSQIRQRIGELTAQRYEQNLQEMEYGDVAQQHYQDDYDHHHHVDKQISVGNSAEDAYYGQGEHATASPTPDITADELAQFREWKQHIMHNNIVQRPDFVPPPPMAQTALSYSRPIQPEIVVDQHGAPLIGGYIQGTYYDPNNSNNVPQHIMHGENNYPAQPPPPNPYGSFTYGVPAQRSFMPQPVNYSVSSNMVNMYPTGHPGPHNAHMESNRSPIPRMGRMRLPTSLPRFGNIRSANNAVSDKVDAYINNIMRRKRI